MKSALVIGGGFAGLATAIELAKSGLVEVCLMDQDEYFLDVLSLHKTHSLSLDSLRIPYRTLAARFGFSFEKRPFSKEELNFLLQSQTTKAASKDTWQVDGKNYDFVVLATGATSSLFTEIKQKNFIFLEDLKTKELSAFLLPSKKNSGKNQGKNGAWAEEEDEPQGPLRIGIIGGGATGVQYAFEIAAFLRKKRQAFSLRLFTSEPSLLSASDFPSEFGAYAHRAAGKAGIEISYMTFVKEIKKNGLLAERPDGSPKEYGFDLMFNFAGVAGVPSRLPCSAYGEVLKEGKPVPGLFAAGDNSCFEGDGLNSATAQAANRKGRAVAASILSRLRGEKPKPYTYEALGYFVSLGPGDGIGWMLEQSVTTTGRAAYAIKEAIEKQFRLYLEGLDTYL